MNFQPHDSQGKNNLSELEERLNSFKMQLEELKSEKTQTTKSQSSIIEYAKERAVRLVIFDIERRIREIKANESVNQIESNVTNAYKNIEKPEILIPIQENIEELKNLFEESKKENSISLLDGINPNISILRPNVKLVDANLAYKYADLQGDFNILLSFTTLFIGVGISSSISVGIEKSNNSNNDAITIHSTVLVMSILFSLILGKLAFRTYNKSNKIKVELEENSELNQINLDSNES